MQREVWKTGEKTGTKKKLKVGDGERRMLEQSMENEQWSGEKHLRDGGRGKIVKKDDRIWVMNDGRQEIE